MLQPFYCYVSQDSSDTFRLHVKGCSHLEDADNRIFLGSVYKPYQAMSLARQHNPDVSACSYCMVM
jgi:hypothetical protein